MGRSLKIIPIVLAICVLIVPVSCATKWTTYTYDNEWSVEYPSNFEIKIDRAQAAGPFVYVVYFYPKGDSWFLEIGKAIAPLPDYYYIEEATRTVIPTKDGFYELMLYDAAELVKRGTDYVINGHSDKEIQNIFDRFENSFQES